MWFLEKKQIVIFVAAGAIAAVVVLFRYLPLRQKIRDIEKIKTAQMLVISKASMDKAQMPALKKQLLKLQQTAGNYKANIPVQTDLGVFLQQIADLMIENGLKDQVVAPGKEIAVKALKCIPVDVQCKGSLAQVFKFFKRMQDLDRLVRIEQVKLANDSDFIGEVEMKTKVVIYYRP
jgi:Tfp pilus assembly protein PilO